MAAIPHSTIDLQDPTFVADPYPALRAVQDSGPVVYHDGLQQYFVPRWADCARILGNSADYVEDYELAARFFGGESMKGVEGDRHALFRGIWADSFRRAGVVNQSAVIREVVDECLAPFVTALRDGSELDAVGGMIRAIPTLVIARMLGPPSGDHAQFIEWSERMIGVAAGAVNDSPEAAQLVSSGMRATAEMNAYLGDQFRGRSGASDDLIGAFMASPHAADIAYRDAVASFTQLGFAGNETTPKLMATVLWALAEHPDLRRLLIDDRSLIPQAIDEINRWSSAAQVNWRIVRPGGRGGTIDGVRVREGATLLCLEGIANRDPRRWRNPDRLDLLRPRQSNMGFGFGRHTCLGIHLARLEIEVWLGRVLDEMPQWRVVDVDWGSSWVARGPVRLRIAV